MNNLIKKIKEDPYENSKDLNQKQLESVITKAADAFFNSNKPLMDDSTYDMLVDFLTLKFPKSTVLKDIGAKIKNPKEKHKLDYYLGSQSKIKAPPIDEKNHPNYNKLKDWMKKYPGPWYWTDKEDGISVLLIYRFDNESDEVLVDAFTRGTAEHGLKITRLLKYIDNIPKYKDVKKYLTKNKIKGDKNLIALRGELVIHRETFNKNWKSKMANARNTVAGLVNSKKINPALANDTSMVMYEVVDPRFKMEKQLKVIKELGFECVKYKKTNEMSFELLSKYFAERRKKSNDDVDGIVVTNNQLHPANKKDNPKYSFAFKDVLEDQMAETEVLDIEWTVSKNGYINPTLIVKPVMVGGVKIKRVTGHNGKYVKDKKLGKGAKVKIIRSGDVIPKITKVLKKAKKVDYPEGDWHWSETGVDIICDDCSNDDVMMKSIEYYFAKLETKGLGEKNVQKLFNAGINTIPKIYKAKVEDIMEIEGFKEKSASNLVRSIKKYSNGILLEDLMGASNKLGRGIGSRKSKTVLDVYPNLLNDYKKWSNQEFIDKLIEINGWDEKSATLFVSNFKEFVKFYKSIKKYITIKNPNKKVKKNFLTGKSIVMSGFRDSDLKNALENAGVNIKGSVSKNTDYLVVADKSVIDKGTGKVKKALDNNVKIITKKELEDKLKK
jgi:NAD-dependent DNA ligase